MSKSYSCDQILTIIAKRFSNIIFMVYAYILLTINRHKQLISFSGSFHLSNSYKIGDIDNILPILQVYVQTLAKYL